MILRPGIADAGDMTVRQFVSHLASLPQPDGTLTKRSVDGRKQIKATLHMKVAGEFQVPFAWSKSEKLALLQYAEMDGEKIPGMQFFMLTISMKPANGNKRLLLYPPAAEPTAASAIPETERPSEMPAPTSTAPVVSATLRPARRTCARIQRPRSSRVPPARSASRFVLVAGGNEQLTYRG